jgi:succinate dehydrogenase / fumarate reductase, membrane anchor subunit
MKTPLGRVRGLGSAKTGTEHWWLERVTSIAAVPLVVFLIIFILCHLGADRTALVASVKHPLIAIGLALSLVTILWHMQLGMRVIIEDYVHGAMRIPCLLANSFFTIALGAIALYAILALSFGA